MLSRTREDLAANASIAVTLVRVALALARAFVLEPVTRPRRETGAN